MENPQKLRENSGGRSKGKWKIETIKCLNKLRDNGGWIFLKLREISG